MTSREMLKIMGIDITNVSIDDKWQINLCTRKILQKVNVFVIRSFFQNEPYYAARD